MAAAATTSAPAPTASAAPAVAPTAAANTTAVAAPAAPAGPASGHLGNLNPAQAAALEKVKEWAKTNITPFDEKDDMLKDDYFLLRFLRARKFDVAKATDMIAKTIAYRRTHHLGQVLDFPPPPELLALYKRAAPHAHHKFDRKGNPVYYSKVGKMCVEYLSAGWMDVLVQCHHFDMEYHMFRCRQQTAAKVAAAAAAAGDKPAPAVRPNETIFNVLDLSGIGSHTYSLLPMLKIVAKIDEDNYPETLEKTVLLHPPWIFNAMWSIIKGFLDPVVASKVLPITGDDWKTKLLEYVDAESLPVEYGGKCACAGGCIPEFKAEEIKKFVVEMESKMGLTEIKIDAGKNHDIFIDCVASAAAPRTLNWYFHSNGYDQAYSIHIKPEGSAADAKEVVLQAKQTVESHKTICRGSITVTQSGKLRFCFDNYSSWRTPKVLHASVNLTPTFQWPKLNAKPAEGKDANTTAAAPAPAATAASAVVPTPSAPAASDVNAAAVPVATAAPATAPAS